MAMVSVQVAPARKAPRLRLTRRGRVVVVLFFVLVAAAVAALGTPPARASAASVAGVPVTAERPHLLDG
ncbi:MULTISPECIES: hypothetical protein [Polymorphospora]|uniref:Uncharacterized protein n=1 Tax=Polymorphospora lycopeni TaxID=3140240 RepID=A0ABV5CRK5_9ACTN